MEFRIADTLTDSLARLAGEEQKAVKTTAFDLQLNPANPGMQFHKPDWARDRNFWSVRVSCDIRLIVHCTARSLLLCYVDHHDSAYAWAEPSRQGCLDAPHVRDEAVRILVGDHGAFLQRWEETGY
jgi:mRNA-degrading endonuclease RelE of RelBE toxin-antitoxin system